MVNIFDFQSYTDFMNAWYSNKSQKSPKFSKRSFAKHLEMSPSRVNEVLGSKGNLSRAKAIGVAQKLTGSENEFNFFLLLHDYQTSTEKSQKKQVATRISAMKMEHDFKNIDLDNSAANRWYHFAVLFMISLGLANSLDDLADQLNLSTDLLESAFRDLQKAGMIKGGEWSVPGSFKQLKTTSGIPSKIIRTFHREMIHRALDAMNRFTIDQRSFTSNLFTLSKRQYGELTKKIDEFSADLTQCADRAEHDQLFCYSTQLFPISVCGQSEEKLLN